MNYPSVPKVTRANVAEVAAALGILVAVTPTTGPDFVEFLAPLHLNAPGLCCRRAPRTLPPVEQVTSDGLIVGLGDARSRCTVCGRTSAWITSGAEPVDGTAPSLHERLVEFAALVAGRRDEYADLIVAAHRANLEAARQQVAASRGKGERSVRNH